MPRLLVVTFHFPPDGSVGGLRWSGLSKTLASRGWEVDVVTAAAPPPHPAPAGVHIHSVPRRTTLNDRYQRWSERRKRDAAGGEAASPGASAGSASSSAAGAASGDARRGVVRASATWLRLNAAMALDFPDWARGWVLRAASFSRELLRRHHFDALVSSGPPHSAHISALLARDRNRLAWRIDMRDPWQSAFTMDTAAPGVWSLYPWMERTVLVRADGVITNTESFRERLRELYPTLDVEYVPNGIDLSRIPSNPVEKFPELTLIHAGTLYIKRDITPVIQALARFVAARPDARPGVRLRLLGSLDEDQGERVRRQIALHGLEDVVRIHGPLPPAEALDMVRRSHLALVLAQQQPVQVPAKLYECVAMGIPTLAITETTSATASESRRIGALVCEADDIEGIERVIGQLWERRDPPRSVPLSEISYEGVGARMDELLRRDVERKRAGRRPAVPVGA